MPSKDSFPQDKIKSTGRKISTSALLASLLACRTAPALSTPVAEQVWLRRVPGEHRVF